MEADRFSVRVREHDGTYLGAIFGDRDTLMDEAPPCPPFAKRCNEPGAEFCGCSLAVGGTGRIAELIDAALVSHDARVTA
jgi:hypothetical protein